MDLALHLGMTADGLERAMTERELGDWQQYMAKRMLPWRRMELHLGQIAQWVAHGAGTKLDLADFMFGSLGEEQATEADPTEVTVDDIAAQFGARVYRKKVT
jgi:hypothetical protein